MKKLRVWSVLAAVVLVSSLIMASAASAFAADGMTLSVSPDKTAASVGETVTYTYVIANNSTDNISNLSLSDDKLGSIALPSTDLPAGENVTVAGSYVIKADDFPGPFINNASAAGQMTAGDNVTATASSSVTINPLNPAIAIVKSADVSNAAVADNITYTYIITNTGNTVLSGLALTDSKLGTIALSTTTLAAGANTTATKVYKILASDLPGPLTNTATVAAKDPSGTEVSATSSAVSVTLTSTAPTGSAIRVSKKADRQFAQVGENITYTYTIRNIGTTALTGIALSDNKLGAVALSTTSLAAGARTTATMVYMVVEADLPGPLTNTAVVIATDPSGKTVISRSNKVIVKLTRDRNKYREGDGRTKAEILKDRGVPGKGIDNAPGLQKFFNFFSRAFGNDNNRDKDKDKKKNNGGGNGRGNNDD